MKIAHKIMAASVALTVLAASVVTVSAAAYIENLRTDSQMAPAVAVQAAAKVR